MTSFSNNYNNINSKKNKNSIISNSVFKESLNFIDSQWEKWNNDIESLNNDANTLQRMFSDYDKDVKYLQLRENILKKIEQKKILLNTLEKMILDIKVNISSSHF